MEGYGLVLRSIKEIIGGIRGCGRGEREGVFIKDNVAGNGNLIGGEIKASIAKVVGWVAEEDAWGGS